MGNDSLTDLKKQLARQGVVAPELCGSTPFTALTEAMLDQVSGGEVLECRVFDETTNHTTGVKVSSTRPC